MRNGSDLDGKSERTRTCSHHSSPPSSNDDAEISKRNRKYIFCHLPKYYNFDRIVKRSDSDSQRLYWHWVELLAVLRPRFNNINILLRTVTVKVGTRLNLNENRRENACWMLANGHIAHAHAVCRSDIIQSHLPIILENEALVPHGTFGFTSNPLNSWIRFSASCKSPFKCLPSDSAAIILKRKQIG